MRLIILTIIFTLSILPASCQHKYYEKDYQQVWCSANNGKAELVLPDGARVDCVTSTHAIEFDFAKKWAESIGQALYYGQSLNKQSGVVLIMENPTKDVRYLKRLRAVADIYNITVWIMTPNDMKSCVLINNKK